jgi:uncharacterized membrane protein
MKTCARFLVAWLFIAALFAFKPGPAAAAMHLCNQTSYVVYTAVGYKSGTAMATRGWTRIAPGDCALTIQEPLTQPVYYLYARSSQAHAGPSHAWGGQMRLCAKDTDFSLLTPLGAPGCQSDDAFMMPFAPISTRGQKAWTTTFTENSRIASFLDARDAGIDRLLGDIGYKVDLGASRSSHARDDAINKFRARMKLAANSSPDDLFDALETEALKAAAPAGYSICNDGDSVIWAALGLQSGKNWIARGWWKISPGGCAKAMTDPLAADKIYLLAEKHGNNHLVSGAAKFCVTDIEFEIYGNERCASRGLRDAGFAVTNTKGLTGFAAHVGNDGLVALPQQAQRAHTPK